MIEKTALRKNIQYKPIYYYANARTAFAEILEFYKKKYQSTLLLPGYIGFSPREGSGIYDPVVESGIGHAFYPMDDKLNIDYTRFKEILSTLSGHIVVLLVHYFGYPDKELDRIMRICRKKNAVIVEDAAHGLYTDYIDHACGQYGDFVLYSLHKMLPFQSGGMLKINSLDEEFSSCRNILAKDTPFSYDFFGIASIRKNNAKLWNELLSGHDDVLEILRPFKDDVTPQTFPIVIKKYDRNNLYFKLNEAGYGAVSLYHTMIDPVQKGDFEQAMWLSQHIINMPVHQDATQKEIRKMARLLLDIIR